MPGLWGAPCNLVSAFAPQPERPAPVVAAGNAGGNAATLGIGGQSSDTDALLPAHFSDYEEAMTAAELARKPVLVAFSGYGCVNCRKMETAVWGDHRVREEIQKNFLVAILHVDDRTPLPTPQRVKVGERERTVRTIGGVWSLLQSQKFGAAAQPFYVVLTPDGHPISPAYGYDEDIDRYLRYLKTAAARAQDAI